jgi:hypothetical protein
MFRAGLTRMGRGSSAPGMRLFRFVAQHQGMVFPGGHAGHIREGFFPGSIVGHARVLMFHELTHAGNPFLKGLERTGVIGAMLTIRARFNGHSAAVTFECLIHGKSSFSPPSGTLQGIGFNGPAASSSARIPFSRSVRSAAVI